MFLWALSLPYLNRDLYYLHYHILKMTKINYWKIIYLLKFQVNVSLRKICTCQGYWWYIIAIFHFTAIKSFLQLLNKLLWTSPCKQRVLQIKRFKCILITLFFTLCYLQCCFNKSYRNMTNYFFLKFRTINMHVFSLGHNYDTVL